MSNSFFAFKHFTVRHDLCAMKVGTDGVLLGAWANGGSRILDIGTGSGLIALCMAQRFPSSHVTAIDIDEGACRQTLINVGLSPYKNRIAVKQTSLQQMDEARFDALVCNPPFFKDSLHCPDRRRTLARHSGSLPANVLFSHASRLLDEGGELSIIIPFMLHDEYDGEALIAGLRPSRAYAIKTTESKPASRCLLAYRKGAVTDVDERLVCLNDGTGAPSEWYRSLTADIYLNNL